jgi:hypothetical protein
MCPLKTLSSFIGRPSSCASLQHSLLLLALFICPLAALSSSIGPYHLSTYSALFSYWPLSCAVLQHSLLLVVLLMCSAQSSFSSWCSSHGRIGIFSSYWSSQSLQQSSFRINSLWLISTLRRKPLFLRILLGEVPTTIRDGAKSTLCGRLIDH